MSAGRWRPTMVWCLALWLAALTGPGHADSLAWQEYSQRIKAWQTITPLGDAPFGEHMSLYTGELSFYQADISLKGRGPDLVIGRSFSPKIRNSWPSATYDSDGHRIRKTLASGPSTDFIYSQDGQLLATREAGSDQWTDYIHLGSSLLARWTAGTATWLLTDRLGSPTPKRGPRAC